MYYSKGYPFRYTLIYCRKQINKHCPNTKIIPKQLTDLNLRTDLSWVKRITSSVENTREIVGELIRTDSIPYDEEYLVSKLTGHNFLIKITTLFHYFTLVCLPKEINSFCRFQA